MCVCVWGMHMNIRGQFAWIDSVLLSCGKGELRMHGETLEGKADFPGREQDRAAGCSCVQGPGPA